MSHKFFQNKKCKYFPCHDSIEGKNFNCLFCYCPLYFIDDCGGNYTYTDEGVKDCSDCLIPHKRDNYEYIVDQIRQELNMKYNYQINIEDTDYYVKYQPYKDCLRLRVKQALYLDHRRNGPQKLQNKDILRQIDEKCRERVPEMSDY